MTAADTTAVKALVESAGALAGHTFITLVPAGTQALPYAIVHPKDGNDAQNRFTGPAAEKHPEFTFHIVGATATSVQTVLELVKAKFVTNEFVNAPTVSGRRNYDAYWHMPLPIQTDRDVTPWLVHAVIEYGWTSEPA